ncbi:MAG: HAD family hydrolase, partial [Phycisphaerae bacterium]|nr:HAD family hydrolase [Phycisphaerae bacterium]NIX31756.1 HAD hydrolase-like protein [Phycisphaerae bacterium]
GFNAHISIFHSTNLLGGRELGFSDFHDRVRQYPEVFQAFRSFVPLIGDLGENAASFRLIEAGEKYTNRESFVQRIATFGSEYLELCSQTVRELRRVYSESASYNQVCPAFEPVVALVKKLAEQVNFAICTTKPLENVEHFNKLFEISNCFVEIKVCPDAVTKAKIIRDLAEQRSIAYPDVFFVDDFARHLLPAKQQGMSCFYAEWGFGGRNDEAAALAAHIPVVSIKDFEKIMYELISDTRES